MKTMTKNEKREYVRVSLSIPAKIKPADITIPESDVTLKDISAGGLMIETVLKLYTGLHMKLYVSIDKDAVPLYGIVIWQNSKEAGRCLTGIRLDDSFSERNDKIVGVIVEKIIKSIKEKYHV